MKPETEFLTLAWEVRAGVQIPVLRGPGRISESYQSAHRGQRPPRQGKSISRGPGARGLGEASRESQAPPLARGRVAGQEGWRGRTCHTEPPSLQLGPYAEDSGEVRVREVRCRGKEIGALGIEGGETHEERVEWCGGEGNGRSRVSSRFLCGGLGRYSGCHLWERGWRTSLGEL